MKKAYPNIWAGAVMTKPLVTPKLTWIDKRPTNRQGVTVTCTRLKTGRIGDACNELIETWAVGPSVGPLLVGLSCSFKTR